MKRRLLSALLTLCMVLTLIPTTAAMAAEGPMAAAGSGDLILKAQFRFRNPNFQAKEGEKEQVNGLRNVVCLTLNKQYEGFKNADGYTYEIKIGNAPISNSENKYYNAGKSAVVIEIPLEDLKSHTEETLTLNISVKSGESEIGSKSITLVKLTLNKQADDTFKNTTGMIDDGSGKTFAIVYAEAGDIIPFLPELNDRSDGKVFLGWYTEEYVQESDNGLKKVPESAATLHPGFDVKKVFGCTIKETTGVEEKLEWASSMEYGEEESGKVTLRVENTGTKPISNIYSQEPEHFNIEYTPKAGIDPDSNSPTSYPLKNTNPEDKDYIDITYTPKENLNVDKYKDIFWIMTDSKPYKQVTITLTVTEKTYTIALTDGSNKVEKTYDEHWTGLDNEKWKVTEPQDVQQDQLNISFSSEGFDEGAPVNGEEGYPITVESNDPNYKVKWAQDTKVVVKKANIIPSDENPTVTVKEGHTLEGIDPPVSFTNAATDKQVEGRFEWDAEYKSKKWEKTEDGTENVGYTFTVIEEREEDSNNYVVYDGKATVKVTELAAVTLTPKTVNPTYVYSGDKRSVEFTASSDESGKIPDITVKYQKHGVDGVLGEATTDPPSEAGTYTVTATTPANGTFAAGTGTSTLVIQQRPVTVRFSGQKTVYNGTATEVKLNEDQYKIEGLISADAGNKTYVDVDFTGITASLKDKDKSAGVQNVNVDGVKLKGTKAANYKVDSKAYVQVNIQKRPIKIKIAEGITKPYGIEQLLTDENFTIPGEQDENGGLGEGDSKASLHLQLTSTGTAKPASVNTYTITVTQPPHGNYDVTVVNEGATMEVTKAKAVQKGEVTAGDARYGSTLSTSQLHGGVFVNENDENLIVDGKLEWKDGSTQLPSDGQTQYTEGEWKFTPSDAANYSTAEEDLPTGKATVNLVDKYVLTITLSGTHASYTGGPCVVTGTVSHKYGDVVEEEPPTECQIQYEIGGEYGLEPPTNAGTYNIRAFVPETPVFAAAEVIDELVISPVPPTMGNTSVNVAEGTTLQEITPKQLGATGKTIADTTKLQGDGGDTLTWTVGGATVAEAGMSYEYVFQPSDPNYTEVEGSVTIQFTPDARKIQAKVYNLPDASYTDYAMLTLNPLRNELKPGEVVTFYSDADCTKPISAGYIVPAGASGTVSIDLEGGTLHAAGGEIYARISNKSSSEPTAIQYDPEPGEDLSLAVPSVTIGSPKTLPKVGDNDPYEILSIKWSMGENEYAELTEDDGSYTLKGLKPGTVTLTASVVYQHPDPAKSGEHITVTRTMTISIVNPQSSGGFAGGGFGGAPSATQKPTITGDSAHVDWTLGADGSTLTITPKPGYEIEDVTVNGVSKGAVNFLSGLKTGDQVAIKVKPILDEEAQQKIEHLRNGVEKTTLKASSKATKKGIRIDWKKSKGYKVDYYEVFRSLKRNSGFGKSAYYKTPNGNKTYYINTKELKKGTRYYYRVRGVRKLEDGTVAYTHWSTKAWRKSTVTKK